MRLHLHAGDLGAQRAPTTRKAVTSIEDHYYVLQLGLPRLLAACPGVTLQLHIIGRSPFRQCDFHIKVPQAHRQSADLSLSPEGCHASLAIPPYVECQLLLAPTACNHKVLPGTCRE